jgi:hypothetical protein
VSPRLVTGIIIIIIIVVITAKRPFLSHGLGRICEIASGFYVLGFRDSNFFLQSWVVTLAFNPQPGGPGPCIYVPH